MTEAEHGGTAALAQHSHLFRGRTGRDSDARVARAEGGSRRPRSWAIPAGSPGTLGVVPLPSGTFLASALLTGVCAGQVPFWWLLGVLPKWVIGWVRIGRGPMRCSTAAVSYTHLRAHET